jgi:hypothetical protein
VSCAKSHGLESAPLGPSRGICGRTPKPLFNGLGLGDGGANEDLWWRTKNEPPKGFWPLGPYRGDAGKNNCRRSCRNPQFVENATHALANGLVVDVEGMGFCGRRVRRCCWAAASRGLMAVSRRATSAAISRLSGPQREVCSRNVNQTASFKSDCDDQPIQGRSNRSVQLGDPGFWLLVSGFDIPEGYQGRSPSAWRTRQA